MDEAQWRERVWRSIFRSDPFGRPMGCGYTFSWKSGAAFPLVAEVLANQPSRHERAVRIAESIILSERVRPTLATRDFDTTMEAVATCRLYMNGGEGRAEVEQRAQALVERLPVAYGPEDIRFS